MSIDAHDINNSVFSCSRGNCFVYCVRVYNVHEGVAPGSFEIVEDVSLGSPVRALNPCIRPSFSLIALKDIPAFHVIYPYLGQIVLEVKHILTSLENMYSSSGLLLLMYNCFVLRIMYIAVNV